MLHKIILKYYFMQYYFKLKFNDIHKALYNFSILFDVLTCINFKSALTEVMKDITSFSITSSLVSGKRDAWNRCPANMLVNY